MNKLIAANILAGLLMISQLVTALALNSFGDSIGAFVTSVSGLLIANQLLAVFVPTIIFTLIISKKTGVSPLKFLRINPLSGKNIMLIIFMSIAIQPIMGVLSIIASFFFTNDVSDIAFDLFAEVPFAAMVVVMAVMPAIFEELAVRGAILSAYGDKLGLKRTILLNGLIFGMIHLNGQQFLYAIVLGIFLSYIVIITNSIFASIIVHFTINFSQIALVSLFMTIMENPAYTEILEASEQNASEAADLTELLSASMVVSVLLYCFVAYLIFMKLLRSFNKYNNANNFIYENSDEKAEVTDLVEYAPEEYSAILNYEIAKSKREITMFYISVIIVIMVFLCFMVMLTLTFKQILFLFASFAIFFFIFFLFRVRG